MEERIITVEPIENKIIKYIDGLAKKNNMLNPNVLMHYLDANLTELSIEPPLGLYEPIILENNITPTIRGILLWEKLPWESDEEYKMFRDFRDNGVTRSIYEISQRYSIPPFQMLRISKQHQWMQRVEAYDYYENSLHSGIIKQRQRDISNSHYEVSMTLFMKCATYCNENLDKFKPKDVIELMKLASDLGKSATNYLESTLIPGATPVVANVVNYNNSTTNNTQTNVVKNDNSTTNVEIKDLESEKLKIAGILNIMNQIGAFEEKESIVEELDMDTVIIDAKGGDINE